MSEANIALPIIDIASICAQITDAQRERVFCIKQQSRADRSIDSYLARQLGYHTGLDKAEGKKLFAAAAKIRRSVEAGEDQEWPVSNDQIQRVLAEEDSSDHDGLENNQREGVAAGSSGLILASALGRAQWDRLRDNAETEMRQLAQKLPVWPWVKSVRGLSDLGLAVIVGEAGRPLSDYRNHYRLWKRMGLAVEEDGRRQGSPGTGASAEDWIRHAYNPRRRAQIWAFLDDLLVRAQWRAPKNGEAGHALGPYGEYYSKMKAMYMAREWVPAHADHAARRAMTKCVLRDLWRAWRDADAVL